MKNQLKKLPDQVMVITGATSGIGLATARMAAARGAKLVVAARNEPALKQLTDELHQQGTQAAYVVADVADENQVRHIAEEAIRHFGRFDTWINNASVSIFGKLEEVSTEDKRRLFDINFWGVVYGSLVAATYLKSHGGALINVGSGFSDRATSLQGIYSASKHAVKGFTDSLRIELEQAGSPISVTLIKPASIDTPLVAHAKNYLDAEPKLPPPIYAPENVAKAILYAAEHPKRDIYVGGGAKLLGAGAYYFPRLLDIGMKYLMPRLQKTDMPARTDRQHNLYSYGNDLQERGGIPGRTHETSWYTAAVIHPKATSTLMAGAAIALAAAVYMRRRVPVGTPH